MSEGWVLFLLVVAVTSPLWSVLLWIVWTFWLTAKKGYGPFDAPAERDGPFRRWWGWGEKL